MDPLMYAELSYHQRLALRDMTKHPGFDVLQLLFQDASKKATDAVIKLSPEDPSYDNLLKIRQLVARIINDVCATMLKSIVMHSDVASIEQATQEAAKIAAENPVNTPLGEKFGSFVIKPRAVSQSNQ